MTKERCRLILVPFFCTFAETNFKNKLTILFKNKLYEKTFCILCIVAFFFSF